VSLGHGMRGVRLTRQGYLCSHGHMPTSPRSASDEGRKHASSVLMCLVWSSSYDTWNFDNRTAHADERERENDSLEKPYQRAVLAPYGNLCSVRGRLSRITQQPCSRFMDARWLPARRGSSTWMANSQPELAMMKHHGRCRACMGSLQREALEVGGSFTLFLDSSFDLVSARDHRVRAYLALTHHGIVGVLSVLLTAVKGFLNVAVHVSTSDHHHSGHTHTPRCASHHRLCEKHLLLCIAACGGTSVPETFIHP
jgi:hypothetical protein